MKMMPRAWEAFVNKTDKSEVEAELATLLSGIMSEGLARIDNLSHEEIERAVNGNLAS